MQTGAMRYLEIDNDLRHIVLEDQFEALYQPIMALPSCRIQMAESIIRWNHPRYGVLEQNDFIQTAEEVGMVNAVGQWSIQQAMDLVRLWQPAALGEHANEQEPIQIGIHFMSRKVIEGACRHWPDHVQALALPAHTLMLEISESALLGARPEEIAALQSFSDAGSWICINDFSGGFSTLCAINQYRIGYLKIGPAYLSGQTTGSNNRVIAEALIALAHKLGIKVIATGVETDEQRCWLLETGCDYAQGTLFAPPMPKPDFLRFVQAAGQKTAS